MRQKWSGQSRLLESDPPGESFEIQEAVPIGASQEKKGERWEVQIVAFGESKRAPHFVYTKEAAARSLDVFNGAKIYALTSPDDFGHTKDPGRKSTKDIVGTIVEARVTESGLMGTAVILPSAKWLRENLAYAEQQNLPMPYELSIDAGGRAIPGTFNGKQRPIVEAFDHASVDVVERGAAGGQFVKMVASQNQNNQPQGATPMKKKIAFLFELLFPKMLEGLNLDTTDEKELYAKLVEADKETKRLNLPAGIDEQQIDAALARIRESLGKVKDDKVAEDFTKKLDAVLKESAQKGADDGRLSEAEKQLAEIRKAHTATMVESQLATSKLPEPLKDEIRTQMADKVATAAQIKESIERVRTTYAKLIEGIPDNRGLDIRMGLVESDKVVLGINGFFLEDPNMSKPLTPEEKKELKGVPGFRSIKEAYIAFTGDTQVSGKKDNVRMSESIYTTDWTKVVADAMNKRLVREYNLMGLDTWRAFVDIVPLGDFKTQHRIRYGGYANLPTVGQGATYLPLTSPTDEEATYVPSKRGGTEDLTREMIMNDDVKATRNIPQRLARAAAQTLHEFVFNFITPGVNAAIYDGQVLYYAASHYNTATTALGTDGVALAAARLRMKKQLMKDNSKRLGLRAGTLLVPPDLEKDAYANLTPAFSAYNATPLFTQQLGIQPLVIDYWTDATDWVLVARREDIVGLEIGFVSGQETPELFVSDVANVGSWFTNDKVTYKIRHEYGGTIVDFRAFDGSIVA